jgi:quinoprotein glucose dehydrogenase
MSHGLRVGGVLLAAIFLAGWELLAQRDAHARRAAGEWPSYGATSWSQKYAPLTQIDRTNFSTLQIAWTWTSPDFDLVKTIGSTVEPPLSANGLKATPLVVRGVMYMTTGAGQIAAIDPATGVTKWIFNPEVYKNGAPASVVGPWQTRGLAYWTDGRSDERLLMGTLDGYLLALDAKSGKPIASFGQNGKTDLHTAIRRADRALLRLAERRMWSNEQHYLSPNSPPVVVRDTVIVGAAMSDRPRFKDWPPGDVQAFDVRTGQLKWVFHTVPSNGEFGADTWKDGSNNYTGNTNVWSMLSGDDELGHVYLPITTPTNDYWGGFRKGDNLFAESIVAVNVETGKRVWHFQTVHHGIWDYDLPAAPTLLDITVNGRRIRALAQVSKQGFTYVFDRATGRPVWPIEERPVPPSDLPGEELSRTQPFPTRPPAFEYQGVTEDLLIDFTPAMRAEAKETLKHYVHGPLFTPQTLYKDGGTRGTLQLPGFNGGANWSGSGADPDTGFLYVPSRTAMTMMVLTPGTPDFTDLPFVPNGKLGPKSIHPARPQPPSGPRGLPFIKPPYSRMTAYNLNTGEIAWQVPTGPGLDAIRNHPALKGIDLPSLGGQGGQGGPLITKTLLVYGLQSSAGGNAPGAKLVAYDKATGATLGEVALPAAPLGSPMTYMLANRQFIALTLQGGRMIALALPIRTY